MNFIIEAPTNQDLDQVVALVALAQHQPVSSVNISIYEQLCAEGGAIAMPVPGLPPTNTGRVARDGDGRAIGFIYSAFPLHHFMPAMMEGKDTDLMGLMQAVTELNVLAVDPLKHGRGIGTALVDDALARARAAGIKAAMVTAPDAASTRFWAGRGSVIGRCALRFEGVGKIMLNPSFAAQGVLPVGDDCAVERQGGIITCRWQGQMRKGARR